METDILKRKEGFSALYLAYGKLLSRKTAERFALFYFDDLSLSEIADNEKVSRSAVQQSIKDAERFLTDVEEKVGLLKKAKKVLAQIERLEKEEDGQERRKILTDMKGELDYGI